MPESTLEVAREAAAANRWPAALEMFRAADEESALSSSDLEALGSAAWWMGQLGQAIAARERAYTAYMAAADPIRAAGIALALSNDYGHRLEQSIASGWVHRAQRLLEKEPESRQHALLQRALLNAAVSRGALQEALDGAERVLEIAARIGDADVAGLGLQDKGRVLIEMGRVEEGMGLLAEAVVTATSGGLSGLSTAIVYCNATVAAEDLTDYRRASEFADAAKRWCEQQEITGFPGMCRVRRAEIVRMQGDWLQAEQMAQTACVELRDFSRDYAGEGYYQVGEIRLRLGDYPVAEEAFLQAHRFGRQPVPGLALLRLAEGRPEAADSLLLEALEDPATTPLMRARLLPAGVEVALAVRDLPRAERAATEMEQIAEAFGTDALRAMAALARGLVALRGGTAEAAIEVLRRSARLWQAIGAPHEVARAQLWLAEALLAVGRGEAARLEANAARDAFERLGAKPDLARAQELLDRLAGRGEGHSGEAHVTQTFMFTDIVRSTDLIEAVGDEAWEDLRSWHDDTIRELVRAHGGEEIDHAGDGFFIAFASPDKALECALDIRRTMREHRKRNGFAPALRIGLHTTAATKTRSGYGGAGVHAAARIAALGGPDEIVASKATLEGSGTTVQHSPAREERLKGIRQPMRIVSLL
ncbi:MAG: adenylate/guanylate cyclase domain-containing protein [Candidatus Dormibacteraeota bacterium]|nr:adenylate/guanylate cyclase domain-containing protein [Candidatus Dormibacteraeota bacterium]